jgi:hypothetical protein
MLKGAIEQGRGGGYLRIDSRSVCEAQAVSLTALLSLIMPRHESVTEEYVDESRAGLSAEARTNSNIYPYLIALRRVDQGYRRDEIATKLAVGRVTRRLAPTLHGALAD